MKLIYDYNFCRICDNPDLLDKMLSKGISRPDWDGRNLLQKRFLINGFFKRLDVEYVYPEKVIVELYKKLQDNEE